MASSHGNTNYTLRGETPFDLGNMADGRRLWIANVDPNSDQVTVETSGAHEGDRLYTLVNPGDYIIIPAGDITRVTVSSSAYPTRIGFAYLGPHMDIGTGLRTTDTGLASGVKQTVTSVGVTAVPVPATILSGRASLLVQNVGTTTIYLGSSTVTADTSATGGVQLTPGQSMPIDLAAVALYAISGAAGGLVATLEAAT